MQYPEQFERTIFQSSIKILPPFMIRATCTVSTITNSTSTIFFWSHVIMQGISNKFVDINLCIDWLRLHLLKDLTFVKYWWDKSNSYPVQKYRRLVKEFSIMESRILSNSKSLGLDRNILFPVQICFGAIL